MAKKLKSINASTLSEVNVGTVKKFIRLIRWDCPSDYECLGKYEMMCDGNEKIDCFKCWEQAIIEYLRNEGVKDV